MTRCVYCLGHGRVWNEQWRVYRTCLMCRGSGLLPDWRDS